MVKKMCSNSPESSTRLITLHITQDYHFFKYKRPMYHYSFSSALILRWTCYPLNENGCIHKTYSIVCRYLKKNHRPLDLTKISFSHVWPLPRLINNSGEDTTIPPMDIRPGRVTDNGSITSERFRDNFPNPYFKYSSANQVQSCLQILCTIFFIFFLLRLLINS